MRRRSLWMAAALALVPAASGALELAPVGTIVPRGTDRPLLSASGLWYDPLRGYLLIADTQAHQVLVLRRTGDVVKVLGGAGRVRFPVAVAATRGGRLYVAQRGSQSLLAIDAYDSAAEGFGTVDLSPHGRGRDVEPVGLWTNGAGDLYVADRGNRQILVLDREGKLKLTIPGTGETGDVWVERSGEILVADPAFGGVRIFRESGALVATIGAHPVQGRDPLRARAIVTDRAQRVWAVEESGSSLQALDRLGNRLFRSSGREGLFAPVDLSIDEQNNLYVLEQGAGRISVFEIRGL
ncbi:MAG: NHL repeat-containing protein [Deltaproteobacteria bacterium]|nr:NHL repeat-containing protein [Deltaproteobacteria bacterium]